MRKFKLILAYDGTGWHGWRSQKSGRGVQDAVHTALARLFPSAPGLESASRTDTGVHALGMAAHFEVPTGDVRFTPGQLTLALNACLPPNIRVVRVTRVPADFHARFDAIGKEYRYTVWNHAVMNPLLLTHAWHVPQALDPAAMREAAAWFVGSHDFRAFTSKRPGILGDSVRTLARCDIRRSGARLTIVITGSGFLYKMCRAIVGTLVDVGSGKLPPSAIPEIFAARDRRLAGVNAPACGLTLHRVHYPSRRHAAGA